VRALDTTTGAEAWLRSMPRVGKEEPSPGQVHALMALNGKLFAAFTLRDGPSNFAVTALEGVSGAPAWSTGIEQRTATRWALVGNRIAASAEQAPAWHLLDPESGRVVHRQPLPEERSQYSTGVMGPHLTWWDYRQRRLTAFDPETGERRWSLPAESADAVHATVLGGRWYIWNAWEVEWRGS
jgi:outer membrane protein assembly factor BamB